MGKHWRRSGKEVNAIIFDAKARNSWLTGFRKRKNERREKAMLESEERLRQDKIELRKERREDIKRKWKEVEWADKRVAKFLIPALKDRHKLSALTNGPMSFPDEEDADPSTTVLFGVEDGEDDDDPFGGCEVTTTIGDVAIIGGESSSANVLALASDDRATLAKYEDPTARRQRREKAWWKEEKIHVAAVKRKLLKREIGKKRKTPGGKKKDRRKNTKVKASTRRKLAKSRH